MTPLSDWKIKVHEVPRAGITGRRQATEDECTAVAQTLGFPGCKSLIADYRIKNAGKGRFQLTGTLTAELVRTCVITLEPLNETVIEPLDCVFVPPEMMPADQREEEEVLTAEEFEPITSDTLDYGRIVFEVLSAGLNPFPRIEGAELDLPAQDETVPPQSSEHPFAALKKLVPKSDK